MKLLFINLPYFGHVVPTIGLVQELMKQGCEVTYVMPFGWEDVVKESGATFCGYTNHKQLSEQIKNAYRVVDSIIESYDAIIYEQFFFIGKRLAEKYYKPAIRVFTAPIANKVLMDAYISSKGPLSIFKSTWITKAFTKDIVKHMKFEIENWLDEIVNHPVDLNLIYTLREYQPYQEEYDDVHYKFLGPSIYERKEMDLNMIEKKRPVIYISLGTIVKNRKAFLKLCMDAFKDEDVDVIMSCGDFKVTKIKNIPTNFHMYPTVPQLQVLKMADVFVTHGGMNSVSEALVHGVPMLIIPFSSDQPVNAKSMERLGVAKSLDLSTLRVEEFKNTVIEMMTKDEVKNNLDKVQQMIDGALGNIGGANAIIEYVKKTQ